MDTSKWIISVFAVFCVTLIFYSGAEYNRLGNVEAQISVMSRQMEKLSDLTQMQTEIEYNKQELERLRNHLEKIGKIVE